MFHFLWKARLPHAVIDCHFSEANRTLIAGDEGGGLTLLDINGAVIQRHGLSMPVWGVHHAYDSDGHLIVAAAQGDKAPDAGRCTVLKDFLTVAEVNRPKAVWDSYVDSNTGVVYFSTWEGALVAISTRGGAAMKEVVLPDRGYGLAPLPDGTILVNVRDRGSYRYDVATGAITPHQAVTNASFNLSLDPTNGWMLSGTSGQKAILRKASGSCVFGMPGQQVSAVTFADSFIIAGDLSGNIAAFWPTSSTSDPIAALQIGGGGVWHLEYVKSERLLFAACHAGEVRCFSVGGDNIDHEAVTRFLSLSGNDVGAADFGAVARGVPEGLTLTRLPSLWPRMAKERPGELEKWLRDITRTSGDPRGLFLLGMLFYEQERFAEAIPVFQKLDAMSPEYVKALLPLASCLQREGAPGAALRLLRANMERIPQDGLLDYVYAIGALCESRRDINSALEFYELAASIDWEFRDVGKRVSSLRDRSKAVTLPEPAFLPTLAEATAVAVSAPPATLEKRREMGYGLLEYILYEAGAPEDEAKKLFEFDLMHQEVMRRGRTSGSSLDVGCATGRWPLWFEARGYEAHGIDIAEASIELCEAIAREKKKTIFVKRHNLLDSPTPIGEFDVVTCMMGTFNHIPRDQAGLFLERLRDNAKVGGMVVVSVWNPASPFTKFLSLDGEGARANLRANAFSAQELKDLFTRVGGWEDVSIEPFCCLPNEVANTWGDAIKDVNEFVELDRAVRKSIGRGTAQMLFVTATKSRSAP